MSKQYKMEIGHFRDQFISFYQLVFRLYQSLELFQCQKSIEVRWCLMCSRERICCVLLEIKDGVRLPEDILDVIKNILIEH